MTRFTLTIALSASALALSACGSSYADTDPQQISKDVEKAMKGLTSVHLTGDISEGGMDGTIDLALDKEGNCKGTFSLGKDGSFELLSVKGKSWFKPDAKFWSSQAGDEAASMITSMVKGRWVSTEGMEDVAEICDLDEFMKEFEASDDDNPKVGEEKEVDGQKVIELSFDNDGDKGTAQVLTSDPHYLVSLKAEEADVTFSEFNEKVDVKAPAAKDQVNLNEMMN